MKASTCLKVCDIGFDFGPTDLGWGSTKFGTTIFQRWTVVCCLGVKIILAQKFILLFFLLFLSCKRA